MKNNFFETDSKLRMPKNCLYHKILKCGVVQPLQGATLEAGAVPDLKPQYDNLVQNKFLLSVI